MNEIVSLVERLAVNGHDPYRLTLHQALAFDQAAAQRQRMTRALATVDGRYASRIEHEAFQEHVEDLAGVIPDGTLDFSEMDD